MPVPVPPKQPAHPVRKDNDGQNYYNVWSSTIGLTAAPNADVIKGLRAQACIPPYSSMSESTSPVDPVTPFAVFVDRAIEPCTVNQEIQVPKEPVPAPAPEVVTPTATPGYRKLAEPLSQWVANYVWKACTTNFDPPFAFSRAPIPLNKGYAPGPPTYLATSVHSMLLSTLLQPSAVLLALWYITKLPIHFGNIELSPEHVNERSFRAALLGDELSFDKDNMEANAPFRLIVLGCMLANKWLDDHTFSNKTWHSISNLPIHALNKLESLSLAIFSYDLSISSADWAHWLSYLMSYHASLSSSLHPQPISRPSTNPHSIVRKAITDIIQAPAASNFNPARPQPVFLGLEERRREKLEKEQALAIDVLEFDLDEDGPLREEYLPRRRVSGTTANANRANLVRDGQVRDENWEIYRTELEKTLPPPAKWSPSGDEPILRDRNRAGGNFAPPHPITAAAFHHYPPPHDLSYSNPWCNNTYVSSQAPMGYVVDVPSLPMQPSYPTGLVLPVAQTHSRSQSLCHDQDISQHNHMRSYSQSRFDYRCSDARLTAHPYVAMEVDPAWSATFPYMAYTPYAGVNYHQSAAWLRT